MPAVDDQHLIAQAQHGDREAFRCLVERHMRQAYALAYRFVHDHHEADEIAQESFVRAYEALGSFRGEAGFGTWLFRIVTNTALNHVKQRERRREDPLDITVHGMIPNDGDRSAPEVDLQEHIERALHELPTLQRAVVILRHINGLSTRDVGRILNCSEGTVKTHLFRGLEKMKQKLDYLAVDRT